MKIKASKLCSKIGHDWPKARTKGGIMIYGARCRRCGKKHHSRVMTVQEEFERANTRQKRRGRLSKIRRLRKVRLSAGDMKLVVPFPNRWARFKHKIKGLVSSKKEKRQIRQQRTTQNRGG